MTRILLRLLFCLTPSFFYAAYGQVIPVGSLFEKPLRSLQLAGKVDPSVSFCSTPLSIAGAASYDSIQPFGNNFQPLSYGRSFEYLKARGKFVILPLTIAQQLNTHHPYGWNDGAMISANGYQTLISAGIYSSLGPLEIQLQPEFVYAANSTYETNAAYGSNTGKSYQKIFPGQSSIGLSAFSLSMGVSSANMWWGPGIHSSLLMSNNAPGFLHWYFSTQKPVKTPIGSFEWQLIGGRLSSDDALPYENSHLKPPLVPGKDRYLNAFVINYQPKWVPGLFVGMTRSLQSYSEKLQNSSAGFFSKYLPVIFKPVQKQGAAFDDTMGTDQLASFFMRWAFWKAKLEFYVEYGFNDYNYNTRDYMMGITHSAAYIAGVKKVFPLQQDSYIDCGFEITQMSQAPEWIVRDAGNWYIHGQIPEGYTNQNQILGAGAGLGSNVVSLSGTWVNGWKRLGVLFEKVNRDPQYHMDKWVDYSIGILPQWQFSNMLVGGKLQFISSTQYAWQKDVNKFNFHGRLTFQYLF
jgi:hypothetical protein